MKKKLLKSLLVVSFLLITFFSIRINSNAASFAYEDFNWEEFLKQHKNYWVGGCEEDDEECVDRVLATKEKFYTRLYSLLVEYEKKGYKIDDNIIIETVFYGLTPDSFADAGTHDEEYEDQIHEYGYAIDESDEKNKYIASVDGEIERAKAYFEREADSLKTLLNNMIGYTRDCYGVSSEAPFYGQNQDGTTTLQCSGEFSVIGDLCMVRVKPIKTSFFDSIGLGFLSSNSADKKCKESTTEYYSYKLGQVSPEPEVNEDLYWDFLINNRYFDNKFQLQSYFDVVLDSTGHSDMSQLSEPEYEKYNDDIIAARTRIVENIKDILDSYGEFAETPDSSGKNMKSKRYWWPIGGNEIVEIDGIKMAIGEPVSIDIASKFGLRTDPVSGASNSNHQGIDISGKDGIDPVIAAANGTVITSAQGITGTCVNGDIECGGRYGNYIVIQHTDGNYTLYAHMATNSVIVKEGDVVKQGQVLGFVGNTGKSTGPHLHFEVRVGGSDPNSVQDPLNFISATDPRSQGGDSQFIEWVKEMERSVFKGEDFVVFDAEKKGLYRSFSYGIVVEFNEKVIRAHGLEPSQLQYGTVVDYDTGWEIYLEVLNDHYESVKKQMSNAGINLAENQLHALASLQFNAGNIGSFINSYKKYGSSQALCDNFWYGKSSGGYDGLPKRRVAECDTFVNGVYDMNIYD